MGPPFEGRSARSEASEVPEDSPANDRQHAAGDEQPSACGGQKAGDGGPAARDGRYPVNDRHPAASDGHGRHPDTSDGHGRHPATSDGHDAPHGRHPVVSEAADDDNDAESALADCEKRAVGFLARREHSRFELERKLAARGFDVAVVTETLDRLDQSGLLSSQRFMASFIASRAARGSGPEKIRAELMQRGIPPDEAATALSEADEDWGALAARARTKRFGDALPGTYEERARQMRFLRGRGFRSDEISAALEAASDCD